MNHRDRSRGVLLACVGLTAVGTWPLIWPAGGLVQRNADAYGSAWLVWSAGTSELANTLQWADTLLFGLFATLAAPLGPVAGYHLLTFLGILTTVIVTEQVTHRTFEVPRPASLIAACAYGLSPLVGTGLAEGHGGLLFGPGLPLLLGALESRPDQYRPWRWPLLVTAAGTLCALQSGYFAIMAALVVLVYGGMRFRPLWRLGPTAFLPALAYWVIVFGGLDPSLAAERVSGLVSTFTAADTLAGIPPGFDLNWYHVRFPLLWTLLAFGVVVPLVRRSKPDRALIAVGIAAIVLSMGERAYLTTFPGEFEDMRTGGAWGWIRHWAPPLKLFRFPSRFLWIWYLVGGIAAARSAAWLLPRRVGWLVALVVAETLVVGMRPLEPRKTLAEIPSAYDVLTPEDTVLDLWPWYPNSISLHVLNINCYYQTRHNAHLPYSCLTVAAPNSPLRGQVDGLVAAILADSPDRAEKILQKDEISHLAWHSDAFAKDSREQVGQVIEHWWGPALARTRDGGESIAIYKVKPAQPLPKQAPAVSNAPITLDPNCPEYAMCRVRPEVITKEGDPLPLFVLPTMAGGGFLLLVLLFRGPRRASPTPS